MAFKWTEDLAVGIEKIDDQHKELFDKVNDLLQAMKNRVAKEKLGEIIDFLEGYVKHHFHDEEHFMKLYQYPGLNKQKEEHEKFNNEFEEIKNEFLDKGYASVITIRVQKKICDWLIKHTSTLDKDLGKFLREQGLK